MTQIQIAKLTPQQDKLWNDTRAALIWHCPAFSHIFYTLLQNTGSEHKADLHRRREDTHRSDRRQVT